MICNGCGNEISDDARFCRTCGKSIVRDAHLKGNSKNASKVLGKNKEYSNRKKSFRKEMTEYYPIWYPLFDWAFSISWLLGLISCGLAEVVSIPDHVIFIDMPADYITENFTKPFIENAIWILILFLITGLVNGIYDNYKILLIFALATAFACIFKAIDCTSNENSILVHTYLNTWSKILIISSVIMAVSALVIACMEEKMKKIKMSTTNSKLG